MSIQRGSSADAVRMLEDCGRLLEAGVPVLLFPEGTRSKSGVVGRFKAGAFLLSAQHGVPIVPIAMRGALEAVHDERVRARRVILRVRVLPAVPAPTTVELVQPTRQAVENIVREAVEGL